MLALCCLSLVCDAKHEIAFQGWWVEPGIFLKHICTTRASSTVNGSSLVENFYEDIHAFDVCLCMLICAFLDAVQQVFSPLFHHVTSFVSRRVKPADDHDPDSIDDDK